MSRAKSKQFKDRLRKEKYEQAKGMDLSDMDRANGIVLRYSYYDNAKVRGEICYTSETELVVREKLKITFGFIPEFAVDHEFGEVLNGFAR